MIERRREGDEMVVIETKRHSAIVDFGDILKTTKIFNEDSDPPWKNCDGFEHMCINFTDECEPGRYATTDTVGPHEDFRVLWKNKPDVFVLHFNRDHVVGKSYARKLLQISKAQVLEWGVAAFAHARGASKQVAFELAAENLQKTYDQLCEWYNNGWWSWIVSVRYRGFEADISGVECDEYLDEVAEDLSLDVARELEQAGYTVVNKPNRQSREFNQECLHKRIAHNLGFENYREYREWMENGEKVSETTSPTESTSGT
jgi:hypothetical protein